MYADRSFYIVWKSWCLVEIKLKVIDIISSVFFISPIIGLPSFPYVFGCFNHLLKKIVLKFYQTDLPITVHQ